MSENVQSIVHAWLTEHGYDGLAYCDDWDGCGCGLDDLISCGESCHNCQPAHRVTWATCQWRVDEDGCPSGETEQTCTGCYSLEKPEDSDA